MGNKVWQYISEESDVSLDAQEIINSRTGNYIILANGSKSDSTFIQITELNRCFGLIYQVLGQYLKFRNVPRRP
jgi:hypothetical protein